MSTLKRVSPVPSDIDIVKAHSCLPIVEVAKNAGLTEAEMELYGPFMAKISSKVPQSMKDAGKYIVVAGINPTPLGEGKSTTTIGLAQAIGSNLNRKCFACIRQPSQGPTFGMKGGAAGGGYSQVIPMENFNLHLTGDIHAITAAHNLIAAAIDARIFHESTQSDNALYNRLVPVKPGKKRQFNRTQINRLQKLGINPDIDPEQLTGEQKKLFARLDIDIDSIEWNRVMDVNDRFLRKILIGLGAAERGFSRHTRFDISVTSEIMAIIALANNLSEVRQRIGQIVVASSKHGSSITVDDLGVAGAATVLIKDAVKPNLLQTLQGTPVLVHCGPFANIAHGASSVIADKIALNLVGSDGYVITEAGFGADIGLEKFINIKCRSSGIFPDCVVIVATVRALKAHGNGPAITPGAIVPSVYREENLELLEKGLCNLERHLENITQYHKLSVVVAINKYSSDSVNELKLIQERAIKAGALDAPICSHWELGGEGAIDLANAVFKACNQKQNLASYLYDIDLPIKDKIEMIVKKIYRAKCVKYTDDVDNKIKKFQALGYDKLPICIAKTQYSFSHDATLKGAPKDFEFPIVDIKASLGAGFLFPIAGQILLMPGLPTRPAFFDIDIDTETGEITGLF